MRKNGDDGVHIRTPHPSGISTTNSFYCVYTCKNWVLASGAVLKQMTHYTRSPLCIIFLPSQAQY